MVTYHTISQKTERTRGSSRRKDGSTRRLNVTLPQYLFDELKREAIANRRSLSAEIVVWLESTLAT